MERDFMGLAVKRETPDEVIESAPPARSLAMQWSFTNKTSAIPQLLSFQGVQEEKPKTGFDSLASAGLVTITTTEAFNSDQKSYPGIMQKNVVPEKQGGLRYRMTTYPPNHLDSHNIHRPVINQANVTVSPGVSTTIHQSFITTAGANLISPASPQPLSAIPMASPVRALPSNSPVVGTTDLRNAPKISTAPAQLTIFYAGSVCVYDNISPEKAQAIMLLAGNVPPINSSTTLPAATPQASMPRSSVLDGFIASQNYSATTQIPSPMPITAIRMSQSAGGSGGNNRTTTITPAGILISSSNEVEPSKLVNLSGSVPSTLLSSSSVPQFRRKSLVRFLEKRKERVITASPYADNQTLDCSTPEAGNTSLSVNSSGSCPVPAIN